MEESSPNTFTKTLNNKQYLVHPVQLESPFIVQSDNITAAEIYLSQIERIKFQRELNTNSIPSNVVAHQIEAKYFQQEELVEKETNFVPKSSLPKKSQIQSNQVPQENHKNSEQVHDLHPQLAEEKKQIQKEKESELSSVSVNSPNKVVELSGGYTHFVCLPIYHSKLFRDCFQAWKNKIQSNPSLQIDDEYFQDMTKIHLTVLMLKLDSPEKIQKALNAMNSLKAKIYNSITKPVEVTFSGICTMDKGNLQNTHVLYADITRDSGFHQINLIADLIIKHFLEEKIISPQDFSGSHIHHNIGEDKFEIKYHLTLMNSKFNKSNSKKVLNVHKIIEKYSKFFFGTVEVNRIELSKRGEFHPQTAFYKCEHFIPLVTKQSLANWLK